MVIFAFTETVRDPQELVVGSPLSASSDLPQTRSVLRAFAEDPRSFCGQPYRLITASHQAVAVSTVGTRVLFELRKTFLKAPCCLSTISVRKRAIYPAESFRKFSFPFQPAVSAPTFPRWAPFPKPHGPPPDHW